MGGVSAAELRRLYWDLGLSSPQIGELLGIAHDRVRYWMARYGIPRRSNSEAASLAFAAGRHKPRGPISPTEERFWCKVRHLDNGCWQWTGCKNPAGYGQLNVHTGDSYHTAQAHRYSYELVHGPIPVDRVLDHLCRNRGCVNPAHLELVTSRENNLRGTNPTVVAHRRGTCVRGHPRTPENFHIRDQRTGSGFCKKCCNEARRRRSRKEAAP
jgi:hypothetical protein